MTTLLWSSRGRGTSSAADRVRAARRRALPLIFVVLSSLVFFGCERKAIDEKQSLKVLVAKYNRAVIVAYERQYYEPLLETAGEDEIGRVVNIIGAYIAAKQIMEVELHRVEFGEIEVGDATATVRTSEEWSYRWVDIETDEEVEPLTDRRYEMRYHIVKEDGRWVVERVEDLDDSKVGPD